MNQLATSLNSARTSTHRLVALAGLALCVTGLAGCMGTNSDVGISQPTVYTRLHMRAAELSYIADTGDVHAGIVNDMQRKFRSKSVDKAGAPVASEQLAIDAMLDNVESSRAISQSVVSRLVGEITAKLATTPDPLEAKQTEPQSSQKSTTPATAKELHDSLVDLAKANTTNTPHESPFDRIDRAHDVYTAYMLKILGMYGSDSNLVLPQDLAEILKKQEAVIEAQAGVHDAQAAAEASKPSTDGFKLLKAADTVFAQSADEPASSPAPNTPGTQPSSAGSSAAGTSTPAQNSGIAGTTVSNKATAAASTPPAEDKPASDTPPRMTPEQAFAARLNHAETVLSKVKELDKELGQRNDEADAKLRTARETLVKKIAEYNKVIAPDTRSGPIDAARQGLDRTVMVRMQFHIDAGTRPNQMLKTRLEVARCEDAHGNPVDGWTPGDTAHACPVRVLRLFPSRNYDLESGVFANAMSENLLLGLKGSLGNNIDADIVRELLAENTERRQYLSHVPRICGFSDAGSNTFGWNFYPTNITVIKRDSLTRSAAFINPDLAGLYRVDAALDPGVRECAVYLVVKPSVRTITLRASTMLSAWTPRVSDAGELSASGERTIRVDLPELHPDEYRWQFGPKMVTHVTPALGPRLMNNPNK